MSSTEKNINSKNNMDAGTKEIDNLVANVSKSGTPEDLTALWKATLNLEQWHFITKDKTDMNERKPFVGVIDNQPWVFVFTDRQKAQSYCLNEQNTGFTDNKGNVMIISMDTQKAIDYILALNAQGVYGMRINEGNGWFSPIANLVPIINHVNKGN